MSKSNYLTEDLLLQILAKLPIKSLIRFTLLSKSIRSLIKSPHLIKTHLKTTQSSPSPQPLLLVRSYNSIDGIETYTVCHDTATMDPISEFDPPIVSKNGFFRLLGCINGLVCLVDDIGWKSCRVVLWNPVIGRSLIVPENDYWDDDHHDVGTVVYGFGCGGRSNEFKVVRILYYSRLDRQKIEIFRVKRGTWEELSGGGGGGLPLIDKRQANVDGVIHWLARKTIVAKVIPSGTWSENLSLIVGFDVDDEVFGEIKLPEELRSSGLDVLVVANWRGLLVVFQDQHVGKFSLWAMEEYGVEQSWSRRFVVDSGWMIKRIRSLRKNGEVILEGNGSRLVCYDPETNLVMDSGIQVKGSLNAFHMKSYVESLVLLDCDDAKPCSQAHSPMG